MGMDTAQSKIISKLNNSDHHANPVSPLLFRMRMFKAWLQSGILQSFLLQINPAEKRSSEHEAQLGLKARKTLTYDPVLFKGKIGKEKDKQPASWGVKISSNSSGVSFKGL